MMRMPAVLTTWVFVGCCAEGLKKGRVVMAASDGGHCGRGQRTALTMMR